MASQAGDGLVWRAYRRGDEEAIVELLNEVFGGWGGVEKWRWKYLQAPAGFSDDCVRIIAESGGRVVGNSSVMPARMKVGGKRIIAGFNADVAVHSDYRRRGLYSKLASEHFKTLEGRVEAVYGWGATRLSSSALMKLGFIHLSHSNMRYKVVGLRGFLGECVKSALAAVSQVPAKKLMGVEDDGGRRLLRRLRENLMHLAGVLISPHLVFRRPRRDPEVRIEEVGSFSGEFDGLWRECSSQFTVCIEKNRDYLTWKYVDDARREYTILTAREKGRLKGCIVLHDGDGRAIVMDYLFTDPRILENLLAAALDYCRGRRYGALHIPVVPGTRCENYLKNAGFVSYSPLLHRLKFIKYVKSSITGLHVYVNAGDEEVKELLTDNGNWFLTLGDTDN